IQLSALFHVRLVTIADNTELTDFVARLTSRSSLIIAVYGSRKSVGCQCGDHEELIDLIEAHDSQGARAWMERHLEEIEASLNFGGEESSAPDFKKIFAELSSRQQSPWR
ncbi:MAG TPA: FCD domain-containing protein, partial [Candidatus Competibacteraceae bacterium]|nr:FCD domain-containing protein [Candidatus Competibacteraceae bacterium]